MKKHLLLLFSISVVLRLSVVNTFGQVNNCPALPKKDTWDTLGYIKTEIPTDPAKARGIWLGQGIAGGKPGYIPSNHPGWAIGIAHAWNYSRNMNQRVEYPKIGYWMATLVQESELACAPGSTWGAFAQQPVAYQLSTAIGDAQAAAVMSNNGCYQIEGPGSAWSALGQGYPFNRFPQTAAAYAAINQSPISGDVQPLMKAYYDLNTMHVFNYYKGWPMYSGIDCKLAGDPYAYEKFTASAYNAGPNGFLGAYGQLTSAPGGCIGALPATTAGYANDIAQRTAVFENNPGYCGGWMASSSFGSYYNANITWANVNSYLTNINVYYPEINFAVNVTPKVLVAFNAVNGGAAIPFKQLGPVIDAIILALPLERPNQVEGSPIGISLAACSGNILPFGHVEILDGSTTMCLGNSVTLSLDVENGGGTAPTFKWYKNSVAAGNLIGTNQTITITPTAVGVFTYCAQICNASGCYTVYSNTSSACNDPRNINGFKVTVNNCSGCTFTASATSVNTPCKGMNNGTINLTLTNAPANYKVTYTGSTPIGPVTGTFNSTGSTVTIPNVRDGSYNIVLEDLVTSTCKAYTNVVVNYTTLVNEYIDAVKSPQAANACTANVNATLKEFPASCNFKIKVVNYVFFQWENWVNAGIVTSTGINTLEKWTRIATRPEIDPWNDPPISEQLLTLNTGDKIDFYIALTTTPGASQLRAYTFEVYDETNTMVYSVVSPAGAATFTNPLAKAGPGYTVTCPNPAMPAYTYTWSPALTTMTNTATTSSGTININFTVPTIYTVTATHPTNSQCKLTDTVKVMPTCPTALPIVQLSLEANRQEKSVDVVWSIAAEIDFNHYVVERSIDGQNFSEIGTVDSNDGAAYPRGYIFVDEHPLYKITYYRLKIVNADGSVDYSHVVSVPGLYNFSLALYPNPFENNTTVQINGINEASLSIWNYQVIDMNGRIVESGQSTSYAQNIGSHLSAGVYVVEVFYGPVVLKEKMVKY